MQAGVMARANVFLSRGARRQRSPQRPVGRPNVDVGPVRQKQNANVGAERQKQNVDVGAVRQKQNVDVGAVCQKQNVDVGTVRQKQNVDVSAALQTPARNVRVVEQKLRKEPSLQATAHGGQPVGRQAA